MSLVHCHSPFQVDQLPIFYPLCFTVMNIIKNSFNVKFYQQHFLWSPSSFSHITFLIYVDMFPSLSSLAAYLGSSQW